MAEVLLEVLVMRKACTQLSTRPSVFEGPTARRDRVARLLLILYAYVHYPGVAPAPCALAPPRLLVMFSPPRKCERELWLPVAVKLRNTEESQKGGGVLRPCP